MIFYRIDFTRMSSSMAIWMKKRKHIYLTEKIARGAILSYNIVGHMRVGHVTYILQNYLENNMMLLLVIIFSSDIRIYPESITIRKFIRFKPRDRILRNRVFSRFLQSDKKKFVTRFPISVGGEHE